MNKNIEPVLTLIRKSSVESLRNEDYVIALIRAFGLTFEKKHPEDYGDDQKYMNGPGETGIYQTPSQFAKYLIYLSHQNINSYLEIGVYQGGTFLFTFNYLSRFTGGFTATALDITAKYMRNDIIPHIKLTIGTSRMLKGNTYDLVFIDADHAYEAVKEDFNNVGVFAKICAFHDINNHQCPGSVKFWNEIKAKQGAIEFLTNSQNKCIHGIGLIHMYNG